MSSEHIDVFEVEIELPDSHLSGIAKRLVGFESRYARTKKNLQLLIDSDALESWSRRVYGRRVALLDPISDRYPLVVFHGDVGTGKTATAECIANALAGDMKRVATLFKLSTRVRGSGNVGEMSTLINRAFEVVTQEVGKSKLSFLIIDEADSLAANRNNHQSHHEDKVGVNTLIQKIDYVRRFQGRMLVFLCTNRLGALDPAILRRVGHIEEFARPNEREREELLRLDCDGLGLSSDVIQELVALTGPQPPNRLGFTFSDIRTRLLPQALGRAFPDRRLTKDDLIRAAQSIKATPVLDEV